MANDFIVSIHALERFHQRFPDDYVDDQQVGELIHGECHAALDAGRASFIAPLELAHNDLDRWEAGKGLVVWTPGKTRGYVLLEDEQGLLVTTVLIGRPSADARQRLYRDRKPPRKELLNDTGGEDPSQ